MQLTEQNQLLEHFINYLMPNLCGIANPLIPYSVCIILNKMIINWIILFIFIIIDPNVAVPESTVGYFPSVTSGKYSTGIIISFFLQKIGQYFNVDN